MPSPWLFVAVAVGATAAAHLLFKRHATEGGQARLLLALGLFTMVPVANYLALRDLTLAQVYLCTAAVPVLGLLIGRYVFDEDVSRNELVSTALIVGGIVLYQGSGVTA